MRLRIDFAPEASAAITTFKRTRMRSLRLAIGMVAQKYPDGSSGVRISGSSSFNSVRIEYEIVEDLMLVKTVGLI